MTGFGSAALEHKGLSVRVEIRSVNHRHLQTKTRLPGELAFLESQVEAAVKKRLHRGSTTVYVGVKRVATSGTVSLDADLAERYQELLTKLAGRLGIARELRLEGLVQLPGVLGAASDLTLADAEVRLILRAVQEALDALIATRESEGASIGRDLARCAQAIERLRARIAQRMPGVVREHHKNLKRRVEDLLDGRTAVAEADLARELALLADRLDVDEELSRLASHLGQLRALLEKGGAVGRQLEFLSQEFFREANTIGSKCNDARVAHSVVELKTQIERLREQVQNVE